MTLFSKSLLLDPNQRNISAKEKCGLHTASRSDMEIVVCILRLKITWTAYSGHLAMPIRRPALVT